MTACHVMDTVADVKVCEAEYMCWWAVQTLSQQFPESDWIVAQAAVAQYNLRNFDDAQELFEDLIERDPHRVEVNLLLHCLDCVHKALWHAL